MGFKFSHLCDLLASLEDNRTAKAASTRKDVPDIRVIAQWFVRHDRNIHSPDTDMLALLSCMFPERRPDRVYWLQATSLARVIGRCLGLGSSRLAEMERWWKSGGPDLGQCVEDVMRQAENHVPDGCEVSVEEIDQALAMIASRCRFSGPQVRRQQSAVSVEGALSPLYRRMSSRDAKWLTRMILKSYAPVALPERITLEGFHFLLPHLLQFQSTLEGALGMLASKPLNHFPSRPNPKLAGTLSSIALEHLQPRTGIKIGRPEYFKARSIKHCLQMANGRRMSVERKYDGEYCQIHIDLTRKQNPIQIFSKSGKDSTTDRSAIFTVLEESLQIGKPRCRFSTRCILEGELLVWSDKHGGVVGFHKLRKFLSRSGTFIGIEQDSPPQPYEHLMIVFFDILLLDDDVCLRAPHRKRRLLLQKVVQSIPGHAAVAEQDILDFSRIDSKSRLEASFAKAITQRWEGYVLKGCDEPYFPIYAAGVDKSFSRWIKLKKDYIPGLGDTVDLALVGACYNAQEAAAISPSTKLKWTHFLVGCLLNKDAILQVEAVPQFKVIDVINRHCMNRTFLQYLNQFGEFYASDPESFEIFHLEYGRSEIPAASVVFKRPFIVEMMGSGFEKPSGARYYTLRFPRILKIHTERALEEAASFRELQLLAEDSRSIPAEELSQEQEQWCKRLKVGDESGHYKVQRSCSPSSAISYEAESNETPTSESTHATFTDRGSSMDSCRLVNTAYRHSSLNHSHNSTEDSPVVHIDETRILSCTRNMSHDPTVLAENVNLLSHKRTDLNFTSISSSALGKQDQKDSSNARPTNFDSMHHENQVKPNQNGTEIDTKYLSNEYQGEIFQSPLTTIPVYMPGKSTTQYLRKANENSSGICEFFHALCSEGFVSAFRKSNPLAASQGIVYGMALINPGESRLGPEIQKVAKFVLQSIRRDTTAFPPKGRIIFLDSVILEENLEPEDLRFCLRETWRDLGRRYYYACLRWDLTAGDRTQESGQTMNFGIDNREQSPCLLASFDEDEVLALGEYPSVDSLLHTSSN
ncbi:hypothetical protein N7462_010936 [Penicillium macrosclerotiorum]|uniref:uncharacterized protein n=1 Tax=Penicillium macrosclerotiorum TaxID=303699 RepID=UPI0025497E3D|nr:uncharacterized protein N7462_010936 [Penicillium macrosclerotiorum]KAJ5669866.1 hypothetical protein N7462_010936 [Penicillium macrosclerotiorum]